MADSAGDFVRTAMQQNAALCRSAESLVMQDVYYQ
jgi:hypothetical protein